MVLWDTWRREMITLREHVLYALREHILYTLRRTKDFKELGVGKLGKVYQARSLVA